MLCLLTHCVTWGIHNLVDCSCDTQRRNRTYLQVMVLYPKIWPGIKWSERKMTAPSGARLWMSYLAGEDVLRYQGLFSWIGFDELTQWATPYAWNYMRSRLRSTAPDLPIFMRATTNPGGGDTSGSRRCSSTAPYNRSFDATDSETGEVLRYPYGHSKAGNPI